MPVSAEPTAVAALAARARLTPREPWLFYREGWDWRWRSWARVADQVVRSLLAQPGVDINRIGFDARLDPDAIVSGLVAQMAGVTAIPIDLDSAGLAKATAMGCSAWLEVEGSHFVPRSDRDPERIVLPASLSAVDPTPRRPLQLDRRAALGDLELNTGLQPVTALMSAARRLDSRLPMATGKDASKQVIFSLAPRLETGVAQLLQAWTLVQGAAWVLEPDLEAWVEAVLWARPHIVCAGAPELAELASQLRQRKYRRHRRLTAIVVAAGEIADVGVWRDQGVRVVALTEKPIQ